jgi:hypothetical protein
VGWARSSRAHTSARQELSKLSLESDRLDARAFHGRLEEVLLGYLADKANVPAAGLVVDRIEEVVAARSVPPPLISGVKDLLAACELARYAPAKGKGTDRAKQDLLVDTARLLGELEEVLS